MSLQTKNSNPIFFEGVVEDRNDPLKVGRVRVRAIGFNTNDKTELPTEDLHWAQPILPSTEAGTSGIGASSKLVEGSYVYGFYRDGQNMQEPIILGSVQGIPVEKPDPNKGFSDARNPSSIPGRPSSIEYKSDGTGFTIYEGTKSTYPLDSVIGEADTSRLTRGTGLETTIGSSKESSRSAGQIDIEQAVFDENTPPSKFSEPENPYNAQYPYNDARETESGHAMEFDDTPGSERIHIFHRTGSFVEFHPDGKIVIKSVGDKFDISQQSSYEHVSSNKVIVIDNNLNVKVGGNVTLQIIGDTNLNISGNVNMKVSGNVSQEIKGDFAQTVQGSYNISSSGGMKFSAPRIDLN